AKEAHRQRPCRGRIAHHRGAGGGAGRSAARSPRTARQGRQSVGVSQEGRLKQRTSRRRHTSAVRRERVMSATGSAGRQILTRGRITMASTVQAVRPAEATSNKKAVAPPKPLPAPNSDFYGVYETLNAEEL